MARHPIATTPLEETPPQKSDPKDVAAGMPAIISSFKHGFSKMGPSNTLRNFFKVNKFNGFDCPGCAWPDPDNHRTIAEFCENGAKAVADEATNRKADPEFWSKWSVLELSKKSDFWLNKQGRITHPMIIYENSMHYEPISWHDAFEYIASELITLDDPDQAIFYTSGRTSNEAAFLWQLIARIIGTNNLPDCSNMCHESSGMALSETIGIGKGTVKLEDFESADLILIVGQNPGTNHPRMLTSLRQSKINGASIISINPIKEAGMGRFKHPQKPLEIFGSGTTIADEHMPVRINGDFALFRGFVKSMLSSGSVDEPFIEMHTHGFENLVKIVNNTSWDEIEHLSGIKRDEIQRIGGIISKSKSMIVCWAMGLTQHKNSVATIQEISNLCLLGGHIGRTGAGLCPVRGHSNVQGDRTVGINHNPKAEFLNKIGEIFQFEPPMEPGADSVKSVHRMLKGESTIFLSMGGNFLSAMSDTNRTAEAMKKCKLTVHISTKPNRSHLIPGKIGLILPCLGRTEADLTDAGSQFVTVENSMGIVHKSQGYSKPISGILLSEPSIVCGLAEAFEKLTGTNLVRWQDLAQDYDLIRNFIEEAIPGFDNYNERSRIDGGFYLPNNPRDSREFPTSNGKANFISKEISAFTAQSDGFTMMTIRSHDQYNTTIYGLDDRYRGIKGGRRVILMNKYDMDDIGISELDSVDVTSHHNGSEIFSPQWYAVQYSIPRKNVATYFPESNVLIHLDSVAEGSNTPTSKSVSVSIRPSKTIE